jgi:hypothetical protein
MYMQIKRRASEKLPLALVPVDLGGDKPKLNLTLLEGADVKDTGWTAQFSSQVDFAIK